MRRPNGLRAIVSTRAVVVAALALLLGGVTVFVIGARSPQAEAASVPLGFYVGAGAPKLVRNAAAATKTDPTLAEDFLQGSEGWNGLAGRGQINQILKPWKKSGYRIVLGVPIIPSVSGSPVGTLAGGASGAYDAHFREMAKNLVKVGQRNAILRLGWEFNGNWFTWSVLDQTDATDYAAYFRQIVTTMRKVSPDFRYVWNLSVGSSTPSLLQAAYPGNRYVDYIGDDVYDQNCDANPTPQNTWKGILTSNAGLNWASHFAASHGKSVVVPEWGIDGANTGNCGLGDDPYFIRKTAAWLTAHEAAFSIYFDFDAGDGSHRLQDSPYPRSLAAFQRVF